MTYTLSFEMQAETFQGVPECIGPEVLSHASTMSVCVGERNSRVPCRMGMEAHLSFLVLMVFFFFCFFLMVFLVLMWYFTDTSGAQTVHFHLAGVHSLIWWIVHPDDTLKLAKRIKNLGSDLYRDPIWLDPEAFDTMKLRYWRIVQKPGDIVVLPPMVAYQIFHEGWTQRLELLVVTADRVEACLDAEKMNRNRRHSFPFPIKQMVHQALQKELSASTPNLERLRLLSCGFERVLNEERLVEDIATTREDFMDNFCCLCKAALWNTQISCDGVSCFSSGVISVLTVISSNLFVCTAFKLGAAVIVQVGEYAMRYRNWSVFLNKLLKQFMPTHHQRRML